MLLASSLQQNVESGVSRATRRYNLHFWFIIRIVCNINTK
jgi:hypothetical protein